MIVFDASAVISAALRVDSVPERALLQAQASDTFALSIDVDTEIAGVLERPRFSNSVSTARRARILTVLRARAAWFAPTERVTECRDAKDDKYLELPLAAGARAIVSGDQDLLVLHPWRGVHILRPSDYLAAAIERAPRNLTPLICRQPARHVEHHRLEHRRRQPPGRRVVPRHVVAVGQ